jgi:hypothetical protein
MPSSAVAAPAVMVLRGSTTVRMSRMSVAWCVTAGPREDHLRAGTLRTTVNSRGA